MKGEGVRVMYERQDVGWTVGMEVRMMVMVVVCVRVGFG